MENTFYRFRNAYTKSEIRIQAICEYKKLELLGNDSPLIVNNRFKIAKGKKYFDMLAFDDSFNFAISEKVKRILEDNNITGWSCFPIIIEGVTENYYAFQNLGKAGRILNLEAINNYETENREFDIKTWDGSDIFNLEDTLLNAITPRVKEILEKAKITNIEFKRL